MNHQISFELMLFERHSEKAFLKMFIYLFVFFFFFTVLGLCCCKGFSLVSESGGYSLVEVHGLLIVVASLVSEHGL